MWIRIFSQTTYWIEKVVIKPVTSANNTCNSFLVFVFSDTGMPTPHYNASVLSDMFLENHLHHLYKCITDFPGMKDAVALIKVWLHQRELDQVLAFFASVLDSTCI